MVTGSNNILIVGDRDALVVDTGTSPAAARAMIEDIKLVTDKLRPPVVNTHFHYDHTDGNQVLCGRQGRHHRARVREVRHREARCASTASRTTRRSSTNVPNRIGTLKKQIAEEKDPARKTGLEQQLAARASAAGKS